MTPRWLRTWSILTVTVTAVLLVIGTAVTSFRVGLADPVWPTEPWRLLMIDWSEPSAGFLIEHTHRLLGWISGALMAVLAFGLWFTESNAAVRRGGLVAVFSLLATFLYLHGVLIRQTKELPLGTPLEVPPSVAGLLVLAVAFVVAAAAATALLRRPGWGLRLAGVALLTGVMVQGLLGGLRVHWHARYGEWFAVVHGSFSQVVFALTLGIMLATFGPKPRGVPAGLAAVTVLMLFGQIVLGAVTRHTTEPWGPRLHLLVAFAATVMVCALAAAAWRSGTKVYALHLAMLLLLQLALGVESWFVRFGNGFAASASQPITLPDAILRSAHALVGYALFAAVVVKLRFSAPLRVAAKRPALEGVA